MDDLLGDDIARELAERMKLFIFATDLPVSRLSRDVAGVERFEAALGPLTPQLRLTCESPPLTPAAAAIVSAAVRIWGLFLFRENGAYVTWAMAKAGPISAAESFILMFRNSPGSVLMAETGDAFEAVFAQYPDPYLANTRELLKQYSTRSIDNGDAHG